MDLMTQPRSEFYVYIHKSLDGTPFYVGKGVKYRAFSKAGRSLYWRRVSSRGFSVEFAQKNMTEIDAFTLEQALIKSIGCRIYNNGSLVNLTQGGEGASGRIVSEEERRLRKSWNAENHDGVKRTKEALKAQKGEDRTLAQKARDKQISGVNSHFARGVIGTDLHGSSFAFLTATDAQRETGCAVSSIIKCCKGIRKSTHGYRWTFNV